MTSLERPDVGPMDTDGVGEPLLRIARALPQRADGSAEGDVDGGHAFTVQHWRPMIYSANHATSNSAILCNATPYTSSPAHLATTTLPCEVASKKRDPSHKSSAPDACKRRDRQRSRESPTILFRDFFGATPCARVRTPRDQSGILHPSSFRACSLTVAYKGFAITARTFQIRGSGRWTLDLLIARHTSLRAFSGDSTYPTEESAIKGCREFARRIIDGGVRDCSVADLS